MKTIKSKVKAVSEKNMSILLEEPEQWFNATNEETKAIITTQLNGKEVEIEVEGKNILNFKDVENKRNTTFESFDVKKQRIITKQWALTNALTIINISNNSKEKPKERTTEDIEELAENIALNLIEWVYGE